MINSALMRPRARGFSPERCSESPCARRRRSAGRLRPKRSPSRKRHSAPPTGIRERIGTTCSVSRTNQNHATTFKSHSSIPKHSPRPHAPFKQNPTQAPVRQSFQTDHSKHSIPRRSRLAICAIRENAPAPIAATICERFTASNRQTASGADPGARRGVSPSSESPRFAVHPVGLGCVQSKRAETGRSAQSSAESVPSSRTIAATASNREDPTASIPTNAAPRQDPTTSNHPLSKEFFCSSLGSVGTAASEHSPSLWSRRVV